MREVVRVARELADGAELGGMELIVVLGLARFLGLSRVLPLGFEFSLSAERKSLLHYELAFAHRMHKKEEATYLDLFRPRTLAAPGAACVVFGGTGGAKSRTAALLSEAADFCCCCCCAYLSTRSCIFVLRSACGIRLTRISSLARSP